MDMNLSGKIALLTGAANGLGRALALQFDTRGCQLLLVDNDTGGLESLQQVLRTPGSRLYPCDLSNADARTRLVEQILSVDML
jgi:NAD(P)-dependent dehydrogenase (short-subunit alcohol dehydrogenase family)